MEWCSGIQAMEGVPVEPPPEWTGQDGETGIEEQMWQLGLGGGADSYPERRDEPDCIYYLRTGYCGYGSRCRFNHPPDRTVGIGAMSASGSEFPERTGKSVCQYYIRMGMCKFGASCKYHHPKHGVGSSVPVTPNIYGYPLRPGEKECAYYTKMGQCKFGVTCKFHHPQPAGMQVPVQASGPGVLGAPTAVPTAAIYPTVLSPAQSSQQYGVIAGNWPLAWPPMLPASYVPGSYGPMLLSPGVVPVPGWSPYLASVSTVTSASTQPTCSPGPVYGITQLSPSATAYTGPYLSSTCAASTSSSSQLEHAFPERPGQPECKYFSRTGGCKFGSKCKYHHPPEWKARKTNFVLSPMDLPLRPGAPVCSHYAQNGVCRFGPLCKFDYPMQNLTYSPSTSSLTDMPVAPYPVGSIFATLAPSSSPDLRPELLSGSKDTFPSPISSTSSSSASVGSIFSKNKPLPQSSVEQSGQASMSSSDGNSTSRGSHAPT